MSKMVEIEKQALVPRLRFPEFRDAEEWAEKKLGTQGDFLSSLVGKSAKDFDTGNAKFIPYMNVFSNTFIDVRDLRSVNVTEGESQNAVAKGDVFFTVSSETQEEAGMSSVLLDEINNCYLNSFCAMFRFDNHRSQNTVYLGYWLRSGLVREYLSRAAQGAIRYNISKPIFRGLPLLLPSPLEQQRIADCLTSLDALIAAQAEKLDVLKTHKKGLMQQLFPREGETVPRLRFPEFRDAGEWELLSLGDKVDLLSGFPFKGPEILDDPSGIPLMRGINITEGFIRHSPDIDKFFLGDTTFLEKYKLKINDLVIGMDGSKVGRNSALISEKDADSLLIQRVARLRAKCNVTIQFIFQHIHSSKFHSYVDRINTSSGIPHISAKQINEFEIFFPPVEDEQQRIADSLSSLDTLIAVQSEKLDALKIHKKGLMQQLFPRAEAVEA